MDVDTSNTVPMTPQEVLCITYIEEFWNKHGYFPPFDELKKRGVTDANALCKKPAFIKAMTNRGIRLPASVEAPVDLTKEQLAAILTMTDYLDRRSAASKLKLLGISTTQWQAWMRDKSFKEYVHELSAKNFVDGVHMAQTGLAKKLEDGDVNAIKYYYEVTGRFSPANNSNTGNEQNVRMVITKLVEVLQRKIKDPQLLQEIGIDFEIILNGGTPATAIPAQSMLPGVNQDI